MNLRLNIRPPNGYKFVETDGSMFTGRNWAEVVGAVRRYRERNRVGDPERSAHDVVEQACRDNPTLCANGENFRQESVTQESLKSRVIRWLGVMRSEAEKGPLGKVSPEAAASRASVCRACPHNVQTGASGCGSCKGALTAFRRAVMGSTQGAESPGLHACEVFGVDLTSAVHLRFSERPKISLRIPEVPAHCWV